jgi:hypothetical protein
MRSASIRVVVLPIDFVVVLTDHSSLLFTSLRIGVVRLVAATNASGHILWAACCACQEFTKICEIRCILPIRLPV